jgi:signal transduction histidine kinase
MLSIVNVRCKIADLLRAPVFPDSFEKTRIARLLHTLVLMGVAICFVALGVGVPFFFSYKAISAGLVTFFLLLCLLSWLAMRKGSLPFASALLVASVHLIVLSNTIANGGIESKDNLFYAVPVVISPLLLPYRWALLSALLALFELSTFAILGWLGFNIPKYLPGVPLGVWFLGILILALLYQAVRLSVQGWTRALVLAQQELCERKRTEAERDKLKEDLFQAQKMESLGRMAGSIAHDFNNLLMVVAANLDQVKCLQNLDEDLKTDIAQTEDALKSARHLNRSLMDFSKKRELHLEVLDLDALVEEALPVLTQLLGKQAHLVRFPGCVGTPIQADKTGMMQVLQNLVINARDAMGPGGLVTLRTRVLSLAQDRPRASAGTYVQLSVRDTGCGMSKETRARIFEPFFTTKTHGTGLGLATVFGVVQQYGGIVEVDSEEGKGTEFRISLPSA